MNNSLIWLVLAILGALFLIYAVFYKGKAKTNYKNVFSLGIVFVALGAYEFFRDGGSTFFILGVIYTAIGYSKKSQWKKK